MIKLKSVLFEELHKEIPPVLYHATFKENLPSIVKHGLVPHGKDSYINFDNTLPGVYLAESPEEAMSFVEASENSDIPEEWFNEIIVIAIDTSKLERKNFSVDPNVQIAAADDEGDRRPFIYKNIIPKSAFKSVDSEEISQRLTEGVELDRINARIKSLEDEWETLDSQGTGYARQTEIHRELTKLQLQKKRWDDIYKAVSDASSVGIATVDNRRNQIRESGNIKYPPVLLGAVNSSHEVEAIPGDENSRHPFKYNTWLKWRYVPEIQYLSWWETPDETENIMVRDYLERQR